MRFSKALELDEHLLVDLELEKLDWTQKLRFYSQIQKIRREIGKGKVSNLSLSWRKMKYKAGR